MKEYDEFMERFLQDLETSVAREQEVYNCNFDAFKELIYKNPINLN